MFLIGKYHYLLADEFTDHGLFFVNADPELASYHTHKPRILLPGSELQEHDPISVGDSRFLFIYQDSQGRPTVTLNNPLLTVNEIALLKVVQITDLGAYVDMGLAKDLFVPNHLLLDDITVGSKVPVWMFLDESSLRLTGSMKVDPFLVNQPTPVCSVNDRFDAFILRKTNLGYVCVVNKQFEALMYFEDCKNQFYIYESFTAVIRFVRPDGKVNIIAHSNKKEELDHNAMHVWNVLVERNGTLLLSDKSSPELIKKELNLSKKAFKNALGVLYKRGLIVLKPNKTLVNPKR